MGHSIFDGKLTNTAMVNGRLEELTDEFLLQTDAYEQAPRFYEVIRVIDGIPLFFEDHLLRLQKSISTADSFSDEALAGLGKSVNEYIFSEGLTEGNIKLVVSMGDSFVFRSAHYYPPESSYLGGVKVGIFRTTRHNPNVKILLDDYKARVARAIEEGDGSGPYFEVLLASQASLSDQGDPSLETDPAKAVPDHFSSEYITEGSRSNAFFVKDGKIWTAPDDLILKGITRKYILEAISNAGFEVTYKPVKVEEFGKEVQGGFLSGTSIGVLPIASVDAIKLNSAEDDIVKKIRTEYLLLVNRYLNDHLDRV